MFWYEKLEAQQALEQQQNPIGGDAAKIQTLAAELSGTADNLRTQNQRLRSVNSEQFWKGEAATAFAKTKDKLPPLLDKVIERYSKVGSALNTYHPAITEAHTLAQKALQDYQVAKQNQQIAANNAQTKAQGEAQARAAGKTYTWIGATPESQAQQANDQASSAIREMATAIQNRNEAAQTCSSRIREAIDDDLKNESWWKKALSKLGKWVMDALEKIAPILRTVSGALGIAALALSWVPVVGEVLGVAALATGVASLVADAALKAGGRDVSASQLFADVIGVLPLAKAFKAAGGLKAFSTAIKSKSVGEVLEFAATAGKSIPGNIGQTITKGATALKTILGKGAGKEILDQTIAKLAQPGAIKTIVSGMVEKRIESNVKDFIKDPAGTVKRIIDNPASILIPKMPSSKPAADNPVVEGVANVVTRITSPAVPVTATP